MLCLWHWTGSQQDEAKWRCEDEKKKKKKKKLKWNETKRNKTKVFAFTILYTRIHYELTQFYAKGIKKFVLCSTENLLLCCRCCWENNKSIHRKFCQSTHNALQMRATQMLHSSHSHSNAAEFYSRHICTKEKSFHFHIYACATRIKMGSFRKCFEEIFSFFVPLFI